MSQSHQDLHCLIRIYIVLIGFLISDTDMTDRRYNIKSIRNQKSCLLEISERPRLQVDGGRSGRPGEACAHPVGACLTVPGIATGNGAKMALSSPRPRQSSCKGVIFHRKRATAKGRKAVPFMRSQLARNKKSHARHCMALPGGRPLIDIVEPKWWTARRQRNTRGRGSRPVPSSTDPAKAQPRIRNQISIIRREQLMLDTYATDRMCECARQTTFAPLFPCVLRSQLALVVQALS